MGCPCCCGILLPEIIFLEPHVQENGCGLVCFWRMQCSTATYLGVMDRSCDKLLGIFLKKWPGGLCKEGHCQKPPMHDDSLKACIKGFRHTFCFRPSTITYCTSPDSSCPELSRIVKSMAEIKTKPKNLPANQCLSHTSLQTVESEPFQLPKCHHEGG